MIYSVPCILWGRSVLGETNPAFDVNNVEKHLGNSLSMLVLDFFGGVGQGFYRYIFFHVLLQDTFHVNRNFICVHFHSSSFFSGPNTASIASTVTSHVPPDFRTKPFSIY